MDNKGPGWGDHKPKFNAVTRSEEIKQFTEKVQLFLRYIEKDPEFEVGDIYIRALGVFRVEYGIMKDCKFHDMSIIVPNYMADWPKRIERIILEHGDTNLAYWIFGGHVMLFRAAKISETCIMNYHKFRAGMWK